MKDNVSGSTRLGCIVPQNIFKEIVQGDKKINTSVIASTV